MIGIGGFPALTPAFTHVYGWGVTDRPFVQAIYVIIYGLLAVSTLSAFSINQASIGRNRD